MFVYMIEQNIRHKSEPLYERYYISTATFIAPLRVLKKYVTLKHHHPNLNQPYTGYLFVFQIFFCAWETKEGSQQNVE